MKKRLSLGLGALSALALTAVLSSAAMAGSVKHVILISVDGLHGLDLANYVSAHPQSTLAQLAKTGRSYSSASSAKPSDSFPGMVALVTGGSPATTGIWYDHTFNKTLLAPGSTSAKPGEAGTDLAYDESIDQGFNDGKWGDAAVKPLEFAGAPAIDPAALAVDPKTFKPVYPHQYILVNTAFEVVKAAGMRTAWSDKHPAYDVLNGPSGAGIDDFFSPEINSNVPGTEDDFTKNVEDTVTYDNLKVMAVVNELGGLDHSGKTKAAVPALLGMNFQAVSVGQKVVKGGYKDAAGTPVGSLVTGLDGVDAGLGKILAAVKANGLADSTVFIITAKHGQSPVDPSLQKWADDGTIVSYLASKGITAWTASNDTCLYLWLKDPSQAKKAAELVMAEKPLYPVWDKATKKNLYDGQDNAATWGHIVSAQYGSTLPFKDPSASGRYPDLILTPEAGTVYGKPWKKIAEHGGFGEDDTHVALLVSGAGVRTGVDKTPVTTAQVAPTLLKELGLDPQALKSVQIEKTKLLPGLF